MSPGPSLVSRDFGGLTYETASALNSRVYRTIFVLGGPGAGKGTQCARILSHYPGAGRYLCHLSVGDLLRRARAEGGPDAALIERCIVAGRIVPVEVSLGLLRKAMDAVCESESESESAPIFLVDGFPRNDDNLLGWDAKLGNTSHLLGSLVYECPLEELERRILDRGRTSGRSDDNKDTLRRRFHTFREDTVPLVRVLQERKRGKVCRVEAGGSLDEVWGHTKAFLDPIVIGDVLEANRDLLAAAGRQDWEAYAALCDPNLVENQAEWSRLEADVPHAGTITKAQVDLQGTTAVVTYVRTKGATEEGVPEAVKETRVWHYWAGEGEEESSERKGRRAGWVNVHFVRAPI